MHLLKNNNLVNVICKLQFVPLNRVQQFKVAQDGFQKQVVADFFDLYGTPAAILFTQSEQKTQAGSQYAQQITISYPGLDRSNLPILYSLDQEEHIIKFTDNAGQTFIMGSLDAGAELSWQYSTAASAHALTFSLVDSIPIGYDFEFGQFFFDDRGYLMTEYESSETFSFDSNGVLLVDGPNKADYFLQNGILYKN